MANIRVERPNTVVKEIIAPITPTKKAQIAAAVQEFVNRIKAKHL